MLLAASRRSLLAAGGAACGCYAIANRTLCASSNPKPQGLLLGITGTLGAGKGSVVEYLQEKHGVLHFSVRAYLIEVIKERGMPVNRDSMRIVANGLRADNSPSYIAEQLLVKAKAATAGNDKCAIIESIRTPGEVDALEKVGGNSFFLVAVDADPKLRYERAFARKSATDSVSFEKFISDEQAEMNNTDPNKQNLSVCMDRSDFVIVNNDSMEELHARIDAMLEEMMKKQ